MQLHVPTTDLISIEDQRSSDKLKDGEDWKAVQGAVQRAGTNM